MRHKNEESSHFFILRASLRHGGFVWQTIQWAAAERMPFYARPRQTKRLPPGSGLLGSNKARPPPGNLILKSISGLYRLVRKDRRRDFMRSSSKFCRRISTRLRTFSYKVFSVSKLSLATSSIFNSRLTVLN